MPFCLQCSTKHFFRIAIYWASVRRREKCVQVKEWIFIYWGNKSFSLASDAELFTCYSLYVNILVKFFFHSFSFSMWRARLHCSGFCIPNYAIFRDNNAFSKMFIIIVETKMWTLSLNADWADWVCSNFEFCCHNKRYCVCHSLFEYVSAPTQCWLKGWLHFE